MPVPSSRSAQAYKDRLLRQPAHVASILTGALLVVTASSSLAQQPKVLAPHKPVPPVISPAQPLHKSPVPHTLTGGLWMTDANMKSYLHITNDLVTSSLSVTPILWLSNGTKLSLPVVNLEPSGTTVISINQSLADQGIAPFATLSGDVELDYQWPWDALCATIRNVDVAHSVIFNYSLQLAAPTASAVATKPTTQTLEGLWWKQEPNVRGFVALTNPGSQPINANLTIGDSLGQPTTQMSTTVSPHGTKTLDLAALSSATSNTGGLRLQFSGAPNDLLVSGGLRNDATGYSANISFSPPPLPASQISTASYAQLGLMSGAADPMLSFPVGTVFTPYSVARNISTQPVTITPHLWWMAGGAAHSATLSAIILAPMESQNLKVPTLLALAGLKDYNGSVNLVLDVTASSPRGAVLLNSGSVDQTNNYVFQVTPEAIKESVGKTLSYWSTANGDDTMITVWNPADEPQELSLTLFYSGGHYSYPIHLEPRATQMFNISEITHLGAPDAQGNIIPAGTYEGSAELDGSGGEAQYVLVNFAAGTYNPSKATCTEYCKTCQGVVSGSVLPNIFNIVIGGTQQLSFYLQNHSGTQINDTLSATWSSSNTQVATVGASNGVVTGVAGGDVDIWAYDSGAPLYGYYCDYSPIECPFATGMSSDASGTVQIPTSLSLSVGPKTTYNGTSVVECNGTNDGNGWGYSRCGAFVLKDQHGGIISSGSFTASESVSTVTSNPSNLRAKTGGGRLVAGTFQDFWAFVATSPPAPQPGEYVKARQSITIKDNNNSLTYSNIRINCLDFEYNDVIVTDITQAGSCQ